MVQFEKVPLTKRYIVKAIKFALRHPKTAFLSAILGIGPYMTLHEYKIAKTCFSPETQLRKEWYLTVIHGNTYQHCIFFVS